MYFFLVTFNNTQTECNKVCTKQVLNNKMLWANNFSPHYNVIHCESDSNSIIYSAGPLSLYLWYGLCYSSTFRFFF